VRAGYTPIRPAFGTAQGTRSAGSSGVAYLAFGYAQRGCVAPIQRPTGKSETWRKAGVFTGKMPVPPQPDDRLSTG